MVSSLVAAFESLLEEAGLEQDIRARLLQDTEGLLHEGLSRDEVLDLFIHAALQNVLDDTKFEAAAVRLLLLKMYSEITGDLRLDYERYFCSYIEEGVNKGVLDERLLKFDLGRLARALDQRRDLLFSYTGLYTLYDRYLVRDPESRRLLEAPQALWMRVAMGLSLVERDKEAWALRFYELLSNLRYLPSTPTLFNSGTPHHQLASCYLYDVQDSLEHILNAAKEFGMLAKYAGGIGTSVTKIRALGAPVRGINGRSGGLLPFLRLYDGLISAISQGGRRRGTMCVYLEPWHLEVDAFLDLKRNVGDPYLRTPSLNTALWVPDEFMARVLQDGDWYLFDPLYVQGLTEAYGRRFSELYATYCAKAEAGELPSRAWRKVKARELYLKVLAALMETGHPWLTFKDAANVRSMLRGVGVIHSGNLCTEVFLPTNEEEIAVCNLASVNLARHVREDGEIDWIKLAETVKIAVRGLDNAIDVNLYPSERARRSNLLNRPIGLGVMGFAELLAMKGIPYDSPEAVELADRLLEFISYHAIMASHELSRERGSFPRFKESEWAKGRLPLDTLEDLERERGVPVEVDRKTRLDWESLRAKVREGMRNGTVMAIAPTATISIIAGTSPGLDPYFSNIFSRQTLSGKFIDVNRYLMNELKTLGLWEKVKEKLVEEQGDLSRIEGLPDDIKRKYPTAFQISPFTLIDIAAVAQKWVDMAISRTLYLVASRPSDIAEVYLYAWRKGLKSTYYCFVRPRMHAEPYTVDVNKTERRPLWLIETQKEVEALQACRRCEGCD
ncbi:MAG: ribonucleoside-diphosphate reductase subunit alpha [Candidatus Caldarchaeales archaeon]|jgi:ribonucleoside-diphosphate reductase alpha chain|nr:ribonucleoside-diphosphate reductase subunit alpha [Candidatus Caldarchaeales archaeon]